jgi:polysaccharide export outer membrane protein
LSIVLSLAVWSAPQAAQSADYMLGPQDVLGITVWNQLDMSGKFIIDADGTFTFPLVGRIAAAGRTVKDVAGELERRLADGIFNKPQISLTVVEYHSQRIFIVGEVRTPGSYPLTGKMTLIEALALAGSPSSSAALEAVIVRPAPDSERSGPVLPGQAATAETLRVDLATLQRGDLRDNLLLKDGDTIFVPRAESVFIFGQVRSPGAYPVGRETTVMQALSLAGGVADRGAINRTKILRMVGGKEREVKVELSDFVKPGDTIVVPERFF